MYCLDFAFFEILLLVASARGIILVSKNME